MARRLELPALGNSMEEGTITQWFKAEGEEVAQGEPLYEVMTDKVNMEVEAPEAGVLRKILAPVDAMIPVNAPVAILGAADEDIAEMLSPGQPTTAAALGRGPNDQGPAGEQGSASSALAPVSMSEGERSRATGGVGRVFASPRARRYADEYGVDINLLAGRGTGVDGRIVEADVVAFYEQQAQKKAAPRPPMTGETGVPRPPMTGEKAGRVSPLAQRVAAEHGVPLESLAGSGPGGKVTHEDVRRAMQPATAPPAPNSGGAGEEGTVIVLRGKRKMVADAVARSAATAPHVTVTIPVDMTEATRLRKQVLPAVEKTHGVRVSFTDIVARAAARALRDHPYLNSTFVNNEITLHRSVHLGVAVSLGMEGLIVPVVRDAQARSLGEFSAALKDLVARARAGTLAPDEVTGGTFSLTNLGTFGVTEFNPIINPPQTAILGVCAITETVVPVNGQAQVRPMMNLCLSFDHRVVDGAPASAFLAQLKETLEQPYLILA